MNSHSENSCFHSFKRPIGADELPQKFTYPFSYKPHPLCVEASEIVKAFLEKQKEWSHDFGLDPRSNGRAVGKMFGVLVVQNNHGKVGFLSAFSGALADGAEARGFVPPVYEMEKYNGFVNPGMGEITLINQAIDQWRESENIDSLRKIDLLKHLRKMHSTALINKIFDQYHFLNSAGKLKSLRQIFKDILPKSPPGGAGECAAPKLLNFAFKHDMKPVALAEFWWGKNPAKLHVQHGYFYPSCTDKCKPILEHMLDGIDMDEPLNNT